MKAALLLPLVADLLPLAAVASEPSIAAIKKQYADLRRHPFVPGRSEADSRSALVRRYKQVSKGE